MTLTSLPHVGHVPSAESLAAAKLRPQPATDKRRKWLSTARREQLPPEGLLWFIWFILAGRGWGKTRTGAEHVAEFARENPGAEIGVIGRTDAEARRLLLNGPSGLLSVLEPWEIARKNTAPGDTVIVLHNGSTIYVAGANSPDALRGLNLWMAWCDELAAWRYQQYIWDEVLEPAVRIGPHPHIIVTTTPKPTKLIRTLLRDEMARVVRGSTFDNAANLAASFLRRMKAKYDGTRAGQQELYAIMLDDVPGALVTSAVLDASRVEWTWNEAETEGGHGWWEALPGVKLNGLFREAVVSLDPSDGNEDGDEQAFAVVGLGWDHELYIEETGGGRWSPTEYLGMAVDKAVAYGATIVVEKNHGGKYLVATLDQVMKEKGVVVPVRVVTASDGKRTRAEPIVPLFERKKLHFVGTHVGTDDTEGVEEQLTSWTGAKVGTKAAKSPDRLDALVWGVTHFLRHSLAANETDGEDGAYSYEKPKHDDWAADYNDGSYGYA